MAAILYAAFYTIVLSKAVIVIDYGFLNSSSGYMATA